MNKYLTSKSLNRILFDFVLCCSSLLITFYLFSGLFNNFYNKILDNPSLYSSSLFVNVLSLIVCLLLSNLFFGLYNQKRTYPLKFRLIEYAKSSFFAYINFLSVFFLLSIPIILPKAFIVCSFLVTLLLFLSSRVWLNFLKFNKDISFKGTSSLQASSPSPTVLLIGGAGYIGSSLLKYLIDSGYKIKLLDLLLYKSSSVDESLKHPNVEVFRADFRDTGSLIKCMKGADSVIHLGGLVGDPACAWDEELTIEVNLVATRTIAEIAIAYGIKRFIFASTCSVYGASDHILDENSSLNPVSLYARSKIASEKVLLNLKSNEFHPIILRFGTIFGFSGRTRFDLVVNLLTAKAYIDKIIPVRGGNQWRPFVHVHDAAKSVFFALESALEKTSGQIFNVGSNDNNFTIKNIGELIEDRVTDSQLTVDDNDTDLRNYRVCFDKIYKMLNFRAEWSVQDGIDQILDRFRNGEVTDYKSVEHSNIAYLNDVGDKEFIKKRSTWTSELMGQ